MLPHDAAGTLPVIETRPFVKKLQGLPPVHHTRITWAHVCTHVTRGMWVRMFLRKAVLAAVMGLMMTIGFSWFAVLAGPLPLLVTLVGALWGVPWIGWIAVVILLFRDISWDDFGLDDVRYGRLGGKVGDDLAMTEATAIEEEHWFREGAEQWTRRQRLQSHLIFVRAHTARTPLLTWWQQASLFLTSAALMHTYLRTYRRTKSRQKALMAASIYHYQTNVFIERSYTDSIAVVWVVSVAVGVMIRVWVQ